MIARFGVAETLRRARGMFAFAAWDRASRTAYLARDPMGEKPLCYRARGGELAFASEVSALEAAVPAMPLSADALSLYFRYGYIPAPYAVFDGVRKLPPGSLMTWREGSEPEVAAYYALSDEVEVGRADPLIDEDEAVDALDGLLRSAIGDQMMADVPLGAFLSGGIDFEPGRRDHAGVVRPSRGDLHPRIRLYRNMTRRRTRRRSRGISGRATPSTP